MKVMLLMVLKGNWTIQEGAENLYILNNKSGKKYKFKLEEM